MKMDGIVLAIETATSRTTAALGDRAGRCLAVEGNEAGHRHGAHLLESIDGLLAGAGVSLDDLRAVYVGTGPGSFTGLRVGLATAKVLAYSLDVPIVGVPTVEALAWPVLRDGRVTGPVAVVLPAGAADLYVARVARDSRSGDGRPVLTEPPGLVPGGPPLEDAVADSITVAVDVGADVLGHEAWVRGQEALDRLGEVVLSLGAGTLAAGRGDDAATLVPLYVALPRGVRRGAEEMAWSPDLP
jgi:tRNA threonylcarbamoyladenosine biosynthesis protein TsaB